MDAPSVCPMVVKGIDDNGALWFITSKSSDHYTNIEADDKVLLTISNEEKEQYLSITGTGSHLNTETVIDALWTVEDDKWFKDGKTDKNVAALKIDIKDAYYWDSFE